MTLDELQAMIGEWATITFPTKNQENIIAHLRDEVQNELHPDCDPLELADVAMLVMDLAHHRGLSLDELIQQKHKINLTRTWGKPNEHGFTEHIKSNQQIKNSLSLTSVPEVECPYCNHVHAELPETWGFDGDCYHGDDCGNGICPSCKKRYEVMVTVEISFEAIASEEEDSDEDDNSK